MTNFFKYGCLPLLVCSVAVLQIYNSQQSTLSPWKGGGFGMYTDIHPFYSLVSINNKLLIEEDSLLKKPFYIVQKQKLLLNPSKKNVSDFISKLNASESVLLKIYQPNIDLKLQKIIYKNITYESDSITTKR